MKYIFLLLTIFLNACSTNSHEAKLLGKWKSIINEAKSTLHSDFSNFHTELEFLKENKYVSVTKTTEGKVSSTAVGNYKLKGDSIFLYFKAQNGSDGLYSHGKLTILSDDKIQIENSFSNEVFEKFHD